MTRINCIPPEEIHSKQLLAEYRELPRIFGAAKVLSEYPPEYVLGKGHVKFFYNKLEYLVKRHNAICEELTKRGFKLNFKSKDLRNRCLIEELYQDWTPSEKDMMINKQRIEQRLFESKQKRKLKKEKLTK